MAHVRLHLRRLAVISVTAALALVATTTPAAQAVSSDEAHGANVIMQATHDHRIYHGAPTIRRSSQLDAMAQAWSERMLSERRMYHNPNWWNQMPSQGKVSGAENVAYACDFGGATANANRIMTGWKNSTGHNQNMLNGSFNYIGVGFAYDSRTDCAYATQNFGRYNQPLHTSQEFNDVSGSHQFYREITWLSNSGITNGWSDGTFRPRDSVSREAFAAFLYRDAGRPAVNLPSRSPFKDVAPGSQFYKEIVWLEQQNIAGGWADNTFRPKQAIERNAMAAFLYRYEGRPSFTPPSSSPFKDLNRNSKFYKEITWLDTKGITNGWSDGTFRPFNNVTREATAAFFHRLNGRP